MLEKLCHMWLIKNLWGAHHGENIAGIYQEETTDVLYLKSHKEGSGFTVMLDPDNGRPLTYKVWKEKYYKE